MDIHTKPFTENNCKQLKFEQCNGVCFSMNKKTGKKHICPNYKIIERCECEKESDTGCSGSSDRRDCISGRLNHT